jgi:hypothetical protein
MRGEKLAATLWQEVQFTNDRATFTIEDAAMQAHPEYRAPTLILADSLATYLVTVADAEQLATLVAALDQHDSWTTLGPAVLELTAEELEEGWQRFSMKHCCQ